MVAVSELYVLLVGTPLVGEVPLSLLLVPYVLMDPYPPRNPQLYLSLLIFLRNCLFNDILVSLIIIFHYGSANAFAFSGVLMSTLLL